jgi:hypothetical protein
LLGRISPRMISAQKQALGTLLVRLFCRALPWGRARVPEAPQKRFQKTLAFDVCEVYEYLRQADIYDCGYPISPPSRRSVRLYVDGVEERPHSSLPQEFGPLAHQT